MSNIELVGTQPRSPDHPTSSLGSCPKQFALTPRQYPLVFDVIMPRLCVQHCLTLRPFTLSVYLPIYGQNHRSSISGEDEVRDATAGGLPHSLHGEVCRLAVEGFIYPPDRSTSGSCLCVCVCLCVVNYWKWVFLSNEPRFEPIE